MKTIKAKLILFIAGILLFFILSSLTINILFLEKYYVFKAKKEIMRIFFELKESEFEKNSDLIVHIGTTAGLEISIIDMEYNAVYTSKIIQEGTLGRKIEKEHAEKLKSLGDKYFYNMLKNRETVKKEIVFLSKLDFKYYVVIKKPLEKLIENVTIANLFFIISGVIVFLLSILFATLLSRHFLTPLDEINEIVSRISKLDFSKKFESKSKDEINDLGKNINIISEKLSSTINELKEINKKLFLQMEKQKLFFACISHEFKTPLGLMRGFSEALQLDDLQDKTEVTNILIDEIDKLNFLINDISDLIKFDRADFKLKFSKINISRLIKRRIETFENKFIAKNIDIKIDVPENKVVLLDRDRMLQLLDNLLSNAINYVDEKRIIKIAVKVEENKSPENKLSFSIYNTSNYISEDILDQLFDSFYRVEKDRSRATGGTGLGLAIVKKIVEAHNGVCVMKNHENGILVEIKLPLIIEQLE